MHECHPDSSVTHVHVGPLTRNAARAAGRSTSGAIRIYREREERKRDRERERVTDARPACATGSTTTGPTGYGASQHRKTPSAHAARALK